MRVTLGLLVTCCLLLSLLATHTAEAPPTDKPYIVVETDKTEYFLGEAIETTISLVNPTGNHYEFGFPDTCIFDTYYRNLSGEIVYIPPMVCLDMITDLHIGPYDQVVIGGRTWDQTLERIEWTDGGLEVFYDLVIATGYVIEVQTRKYNMMDATAAYIVDPPPPPPPPKDGMRGAVTGPSRLLSNYTAEICVSVTDDDNMPLQGVNVSTAATHGSTDPVEVVTGSTGQACFGFLAPALVNDTALWVLLSIAKLSKEGYTADYLDYMMIKVVPDRPPHSPFLVLDPIPTTAQFAYESREADFLVYVLDQNHTAVVGSTLIVWTEPEGLEYNLTPANETATNETGEFLLQVSAPAVENDTMFLIHITAEKEGYANATRTLELFVLDTIAPSVYEDDVLPYCMWILVGTVLAVSIGGAILLATKMRGTGRRKK